MPNPNDPVPYPPPGIDSAALQELQAKLREITTTVEKGAKEAAAESQVKVRVAEEQRKGPWDQQVSTPSPLRMKCEEMRASLLVIERAVRALKDDPTFKGEQAYAGQHGEMIAQLMLAVRHIEDARMRIGKVLQYSGNGISIYDKA